MKIFPFAFTICVMSTGLSFADDVPLCPDQVDQTMICSVNALTIMRLVYEDAPGYAETLDVVNAPAGDDNVIQTVQIDDITYAVYDLVSQGFNPNDPIYAVRID